MDGKSRWADTIMIERWFRNFKYEEPYLTQYNNINQARQRNIFILIILFVVIQLLLTFQQPKLTIWKSY